MTTLYNMPVKKTSKYVIHKHVAGDLSFSYEVRSPDMVNEEEEWGLQGFGIPAKSLKDAIHVGELVGKYGYDKAREIWDKEVKKKYGKFGYHFGYLPARQKLTMELAPYAYGDYAKKIMKKMRMKK